MRERMAQGVRYKEPKCLELQSGARTISPSPIDTDPAMASHEYAAHNLVITSQIGRPGIPI